ncbi:hypothetical protein DFJ58DRAFT_772976, partial [Suillus subalutaceus]|uniref:uncharacterized protein n=1 Tax=Suillus subalutaceus TaxID=48586 RepID=UPI001B8733A0
YCTYPTFSLWLAALPLNAHFGHRTDLSTVPTVAGVIVNGRVLPASATLVLGPQYSDCVNSICNVYAFLSKYAVTDSDCGGSRSVLVHLGDVPGTRGVEQFRRRNHMRRLEVHNHDEVSLSVSNASRAVKEWTGHSSTER